MNLETLLFQRHDEAGFARFTLEGEPDAVTANQFLDELAARPPPGNRIVVDIRRIGTIGADARDVCYRRASEFQNLTTAIVGRTMLHRLVVNFVLVATRHKNARYFVDEQEALEWLRQRRQTS